jgi:hypothetical protein
MYYEIATATDAARIEIELAESRAARNWRFRNHHSRATKALTAILTSVLGFLFG